MRADEGGVTAGRIFKWCLGGAGVLALVLVGRTLGFTSRQIEPAGVQPIAVDAGAAAARLAAALRFQTIASATDPEANAAAFDGLRDHLERSFPGVHRSLKRELVSGRSLLYTWQGRESALAPVLLVSHQDVVPVEPGTEARWTHPPFDGVVSDGVIWGRGALDDKVGVLGLLEAVELLLAQGFAPRRSVILAFGQDEEVSGTLGAARIAALLRERGVRPWFVLDEGLAVTEDMVPGLAAPVAVIGTSEKGYATIELLVGTQGGHSSTPPPETAIGILAGAVHRVEAQPMPSRLGGPVRRLFDVVGREMGWWRRLVFANLWLFGPLVEHQLKSSRGTAALLHTTTAPTVFQAGEKENVLATRARALVNFRILPGDSVAAVREHVERVVADPRVRVSLLPGASEPSPESDPDDPAFGLLARSVREIFRSATVAPSVMIGAADARHYVGLSRNVYRFVPIPFRPEDLARVHGTDERLGVSAYARAVGFYAQLIKNADAASALGASAPAR